MYEVLPLYGNMSAGSGTREVWVTLMQVLRADRLWLGKINGADPDISVWDTALGPLDALD